MSEEELQLSFLSETEKVLFNKIEELIKDHDQDEVANVLTTILGLNIVADEEPEEALDIVVSNLEVLVESIELGEEPGHVTLS